MYFDPNTNFVENEKGTQNQSPKGFQRQTQSQIPISPIIGQQNTQQTNSEGPQLNERIAKIRIEQQMEEQQDYDQILERDPKKLEQMKEMEYLEKLKKNPFIKQTYTSSLDQENLKILILFNTKQNFDYKLQHYLYFSNQPNQNYNLKYYNKYHLQTQEPNLKAYLKFSDKEPDYVLVRRSKMLKNYGQLSIPSVDNEQPNVIQTKPYRGFYSNQYDYQFFKMQMQSEKTNYND